jgi:hypothetical protein
MALNNVPLAGQSLLASRDQIANNFTSIDTGFSVNHTAFGAGAGKHEFLTIPAGAAHATLANEVALYSKLVGGNPELFFRRNNSGTEIAFTESSNPLTTNPGWCRLPCGLLMYYGVSVATYGNGTNNIAFPVGAPAIATVVGVSLTLRGQNGNTGSIYYIDIAGGVINFHIWKGSGPDFGVNYLLIGI